MLIALGASRPARAAIEVAEIKNQSLQRPSPLAVGDRIEFVRAADGNSLAVDNVLSWVRIEVELLARGSIEVSGTRAGKPLRWTIHPFAQEMRAETRGPDSDSPATSAALSQLDAQVSAMLAATRTGDAASADAAYAAALLSSADPGVGDQVRILWLLGARAAYATGRPELVLTRLDQVATAATEDLLDAALLEMKALAMLALNRFAEEQALLKRVLELRERLAPGAMAQARTLTLYANALSLQYRPTEAMAPTADALARLDPACADCLELTKTLMQRAAVLNQTGQAADAARLQARALALIERLNPAARDLPMRRIQLASYLRSSGQFDAAEVAARGALEQMQALGVPTAQQAAAWNLIATMRLTRDDYRAAESALLNAEKLLAGAPPGEQTLLNVRDNRAAVLHEQGRLGAAQQLLLGVLADRRQYQPGSRNLVASLVRMALIERDRGDLVAAAAALDEAASVVVKVAPNGTNHANVLSNQAEVDVLLGENLRAEQRFQAAVAIAQAQPDDCYCGGATLLDFANFQIDRGRPKAALPLLQRAAALLEQMLGNRDTDYARLLVAQARAHRDLSEFKTARNLAREAVSILRSGVPESIPLARALDVLGSIEAARGNNAGARTAYCDASSVFDRVGSHVGGGDLAEVRFRAEFASVYRACMDATEASAGAAAAFGVFERWRARVFLESLQKRDLDLAALGPSDVLEAWQAHELALRAVDSVLDDPSASAQMRSAAHADSLRLSAARKALEERLYSAAPRLAAQLIPHSVDASEARELLPAGSAFLAYVVGERETLLFVLRRDRAPQFLRLAIGRLALTELTTRWRTHLLARSDADLGALDADASELYAQLITPAQQALEGTSTLLIATDGPLHGLAFAALRNAVDGRFLIERWALHYSDSMSMRSALAKASSSATAEHWLAIADPDPPQQIYTQLDSAMRGSSTLSPLPGARSEVLALANQHPRSTLTLIGADATEVRVRAEMPAAGLVHFAVHALINPQRPLESALLLRPGAVAVPGESAGDGLLQAFEVFEDVHLQGDLVVLSACDTGLGKDYAGEGIIGFTRAFQFAGASAVMVSLWPVQDAGTAQLMQAFYRQFERVKDPVQALRAAMLEQLHSPAGSSSSVRGVGGLVPRQSAAPPRPAHPYDWAAFQLHGG